MNEMVLTLCSLLDNFLFFITIAEKMFVIFKSVFFSFLSYKNNTNEKIIRIFLFYEDSKLKIPFLKILMHLNELKRKIPINL